MRSTWFSVCKRALCMVLGALMCLPALLAVGSTAVLSASAAGDGKIYFVRPALELSLGETDTIKPMYRNLDGQKPPVTFTSADPSIVSVDDKGNIEAKKVGSTTITMACASIGETAEISVKVIEKEHSFDDNIMITMFWPPNPANMANEEQYALLADAGITQVFGAGGGMDTKELQEKMLLLCDKYGMGLTLGGYFGNWVADWTDQEFEYYTSLYRNVPAAYGFHMVDEPWTANGFARAYLGLRKHVPNAYCHLNFLPYQVYDSLDTYKAIMTDYARLVGAGGDHLEYLMFDRYPYGTTPGSMDRDGFYTNLRAVYEVGLRERVKTGVYIQTVAIPGALRRPTDAEIRYEMYAALAYGYKQLSFFTWFTPVGQGEPFADGIIAPNGKPNAHYEAIKEINHEILAIGPTLVKCDALGVYFSSKKNDSTVYGQPTIPSDFFVQVTNNAGASKAIVSWMRHRETGRNYLMVVNNDYAKSTNVKLRFDSAITSVSEVSRVDGSLVPLSMDGAKLELELAAGDAIFLALPEDFDYYKAPEGQPDAEVNLGADALMYAPSSVGSNGWFIENLNDGNRYTPVGSSTQAWRSVDDADTFVTIDLGRTLDFDRVDLYGIGSAFNYGEAFPENITASVSDDGQTWREVKRVTGIEITAPRAYMLELGEQTARFIRLDFTDIQNSFGYVALDEIEVYNDRGRLPDPADIPFFSTGDEVITYKDGENIALGKKPFASSATDEEFKNLYGWSLDFLNDGKPDTGWTTAVRRNDHADVNEYCGVFFGDVFAVEKIVITPKGCYPEDLVVELTTDCKSWTKVYEITGSEPENGKKPLVIELDTPVPATLIRITGTKLRADGGGNGYLFQLGEVEAYGRPICDKSLLEAAMNTFVAEGGNTEESVYADAMAAMENEFLTSTQAQKLMQELYVLVGRNPDGSETTVETEPVTEPATEPMTESDTEGTLSGDAVTAITTTAEATTEPSKGCGSAIGGGAALALLAAGAVALRAKRRRED